jgi:putative OPT family oligopeptide transporter
MDKEKIKFKPYISTEKKVPEFTLKASILGLLFGFIFAIANAYLGLKTGTTISASIPAAILSMAILRMFFKKVSILENNIVQTIATVGEGMASGIVFTIPALFFLGQPLSLSRIFILSALGGILGILFMIPMRRFIIVKEHKTLPFPEGTACAQILKAGEKNASGAAITAIWGFLAAALFKICTNIFYFFEEIPTWIIGPFKKTEFSIDATPSLLGIGYIMGSHISYIMFAGGAFSWFVIIPLIKTFGLGTEIIYPSTTPVMQMTASEIWSDYVRYIGAGAVAAGGVIGLFKIIPVVIKTFKAGIKVLFSGFKSQEKSLRTDRDISLAWLVLGSTAVILTLWILPIASMNFLAIIILITIGFFFVAVTSITVGLVGSSSNPSSGMTVTTLLITCLLFLSLGWTEKIYLIMSISLGCVVNVAISLAATTSQDLKTGFLLGATPKSQQLAELIGILIPAMTLGITIYMLNKAYGIGSPQMPAPQATLMAMIAKGVINGQLPFILVLIGVAFGLFIWLCRLPVLPVAIGLYLPLSLSSGILVGGLLSAVINKFSKREETKEKGILVASGMIGGDACLGIVIAGLAITGIVSPDQVALLPSYVSLIMFALLALTFSVLTFSRQKK